MQQPPAQPPPPTDGGPSEFMGALVTVGIAIASSLFGRLYFQLILGAQSGPGLFVGSALLPAALVLSLGAWRAIFIPLALVRLAGQALRRQAPAEEEPTPARAPGRFILLLIPPMVCLTVGVGLGVLTKLSLVGTALQLLVLGSVWGVVLFILAGAGFFRFVFEE